MKKLMILLIILSLSVPVALGQTKPNDFPILSGPYLGQKPPGTTPEIFAPDLVSVGEGVHGNIVFKSDFSEAAWHPNYLIEGKSLILRMKYEDGSWKVPTKVYFDSTRNYSEPFYSYDGTRLYFLTGAVGSSGNAENEKIWSVEIRGVGWSEPGLLDPIFDSFPTHWQFSFDKKNNLYFGSKTGTDKSGEIYFSKFENGKYTTPVKLPATINSDAPEFSPFISPDDSYLIFTRLLQSKTGPPQMNLFVSFRDNNSWTETINLTEKLNMAEKTPVIMMSAARITPDGKYLFFTYFNGKGHMVYWVDEKVIEELKPKGLKE
jgi:hypothetical protein